MALLPDYEYDIFISYAHVDNIAFPGQRDGWIKQFYQNLNLMLAKRFGRMDMVKIWWDERKLDGSILFDDSIEEGIQKSAIMICLNSPGYKASEYCNKELSLFHNKAKAEPNGLQIGNQARILHVLLNNIPHPEWPEELSGTSGFPFHDAQESEAFGDTLETITPEFKAEMQRLRDSVWQLLTSFPKNPEITEVLEEIVSEEAADDSFTVYLGEVPDTLRSQRKRLKVELEKDSYKIIDGVPPPDEAEAHEQATNDALQKSQLAIHLLDQYPGREITGSPDIWYPQKQVEISLNSPIPQIIWMPDQLDLSEIDEEAYLQFIKAIEDGKLSDKEYEFIKGSKSTLAMEIIDYAEQLKAKQKRKITEEGPLSVLLDTHITDQMYAYDLGKTLLKHNIQPYINPQEDDPRKNINELGNRMSQVNKLVFLYGNVSKEWVIERMNAALQLILTNNYPIEDFFIYMAPPHKEADDININQRLLRVNVINSSEAVELNTDVVEQFLNDLKSKAK